MSDRTQRLGLLGERIAERWLLARGWRTLERRFRVGHREVDLVMGRGSEVAFVEVKARRASAYGGPLGAVNWRKRKEMARVALVWIDRHGRPGQAYRFDVVGVVLDGDRARVRHVENAFSLEDRA